MLRDVGIIPVGPTDPLMVSVEYTKVHLEILAYKLMVSWYWVHLNSWTGIKIYIIARPWRRFAIVTYTW